MSKIATLILNFNDLNNTLECLKSLKDIKTIGFDHQIFLVDYGKQNQTSKFKATFPSLNLYRQEANLGFSAANNFLIKKAFNWGADYILLLNNDTLVSPNFIKTLYKYLDSHPQVAAVSPKIYFAKGFEFHKNKYDDKDLGKVIWYAGGKIDWQNLYCSHLGVDQVDQAQFDQIYSTDFFSGCCALINVPALNHVGLFDPKYFLYWEDVDLSYRLKKAGYNISYCGKTHIWHKNAGSSSVGSDLQTYFLNRNRLYFGLKYARPKTKLALLKQSLSLLKGTKWQKQATLDFYFAKMGIGSWKD